MSYLDWPFFEPRHRELTVTLDAWARANVARRALAEALARAASRRRGHVVERLYREIRALRIYEGASEVQKLIIARELLREQGEKRA